MERTRSDCLVRLLARSSNLVLENSVEVGVESRFDVARVFLNDRYGSQLVRSERPVITGGHCQIAPSDISRACLLGSGQGLLPLRT